MVHLVGFTAPAACAEKKELLLTVRHEGVSLESIFRDVFRKDFDVLNRIWYCSSFATSDRVIVKWEWANKKTTLLHCEWRLFACSSVQLITNANVHNGFIGQHKQQLSSRLERLSNDVAKWHLSFKRSNRSHQFIRWRPSDVHHSGNCPVSSVWMATLWNAPTTMGGKWIFNVLCIEPLILLLDSSLTFTYRLKSLSFRRELLYFRAKEKGKRI